MSSKEVLNRLVHWRWLPFVLPVAFSLFFVGAVVLFIPESLQDNAEEADSVEPTALVDDLKPSTTSGTTRRAATRLSSRLTQTPHNARISPPRTGPGRTNKSQREAMANRAFRAKAPARLGYTAETAEPTPPDENPSTSDDIEEHEAAVDEP